MALRDKLRTIRLVANIRLEKLIRGQCEVCARPYDPSAAHMFHFDHTHPGTKRKAGGRYSGSVFSIGRRFGLQTMLDEIERKCVMLCRRCHIWKSRFDRLSTR